MTTSPKTTIHIDKHIAQQLKDIGQSSKQTYNELLRDMITVYTQHDDSFLHTIQQQKMKELWDNQEDEAWKDA
ncbi:MAG: hypothetical protein ACMXYC_05155 [Candidatus Woesearchaeota archaeon]